MVALFSCVKCREYTVVLFAQVPNQAARQWRIVDVWPSAVSDEAPEGVPDHIVDLYGEHRGR